MILRCFYTHKFVQTGLIKFCTDKYFLKSKGYHNIIFEAKILKYKGFLIKQNQLKFFQNT